MNKKTFIVPLLFAGLLAACAGGNPSSQVTSGGGSTTSGGSTSGKTSSKDPIDDPWWETTGELRKDASGEVEFEDVTIKFTTVVSGSDLPPFTELVDQFNEENEDEIYIELTNMSDASFESDIAKAITSGVNAPDLIMSHHKGHKTFAANHLTQPFDEACEKSGMEIDMRDYAYNLSKYADMGHKGWTFGVPIDGASYVMFFNKQILNDLGKDVPTNREEFMDVCAAFKSSHPGTGNYAVAWGPGDTNSFWTRHLFFTTVAQNGGQFFGSDDYVNWYSDETNRDSFLSATRSLRELATNGYASMDMTGTAASNAFYDDKALFLFTSPWGLKDTLMKYSNTHGGLPISQIMSDYVGACSDAGLFCVNDSGDSQLIFGDSHFFGMTRCVKDITKKAAIVKFIKWFNETPEIATKWAEAGHISVNTVASSADIYQENIYVQEYISKWYSDLDNFITTGNTEYYSFIFPQLEEYIQTVYNKKDASFDEQQLQIKETYTNRKIQEAKEEED